MVCGADENLGEYQDRRDLSKVDCSNTIWILATNALDDTIKDFCQRNPDIFSKEGTEREVLAKDLSKTMRTIFLRKFGVRTPALPPYSRGPRETPKLTPYSLL